MATDTYTLIRDIHKKMARPLMPIPTGEEAVLPALPGIKAVLFDIYGTLLVSGSGDVGTAEASSRSDIFHEVIEQAADSKIPRHFGIAAEKLYFDAISSSHEVSRSRGILHPEVDIIRIWREVLQTFNSKHSIDLDITQGLCEAVAIEYEERINPVSLMPGANEILGQLSSSRFGIGIISNAQFFTPHLLSLELGSKLENAGFSSELCSYSYVSGVAKPSPNIFAPVLARLKQDYSITPENTLYVGNDMLNDVLTASQVGCRTCLFAGDARSLRRREDDKRCESIRPDAIITDLNQISLLLV